jgi:hypothetical protein
MQSLQMYFFASFPSAVKSSRSSGFCEPQPQINASEWSKYNRARGFCRPHLQPSPKLHAPVQTTVLCSKKENAPRRILSNSDLSRLTSRSTRYRPDTYSVERCYRYQLLCVNCGRSLGISLIVSG